MSFRHTIAYIVAIFGLAACFAKDGDKKTAAPCQKPGQAIAKALSGKSIHFEGPHAIGGAGDYLLQNDQAAYIIQGVDRGISYYHYGGILVDAVAMNGCAQASPEQFDELGLMLGELKLDDFTDSTLRAFRATTVEVLNDGKNGEAAVVRATGVDDYYWLIEYVLVAEKARGGGKKLLSQPYGIDIQVDYILYPNSPVLQIEYSLINVTEGKKEFMAGGIMTHGDETDEFRFALSSIDFGGYSFNTSVPWLVAQTLDGRGAYAFTISDANVGAATISGVNAIFNLDHALTGMQRRQPGDTGKVTMLFSTGPSDAHSALAPFASFGIAWPDDLKFHLKPLSATVVDAVSQAPIADASVDLEIEADGMWHRIDSYRSDAAGLIGPTRLHFVNQTYDYRLVPSTPDRGRFTFKALAESDAEFDVTMGTAGKLAYDIKDDEGRALPAKITLWQNGQRTHREFVWGEGVLPVAPGVYEISITRGFEYRPYHGWVTVPSGSATQVASPCRMSSTRLAISRSTRTCIPAPAPTARCPSRCAFAMPPPTAWKFPWPPTTKPSSACGAASTPPACTIG